jgi:hypothetical protein
MRVKDELPQQERYPQVWDNAEPQYTNAKPFHHFNGYDMPIPLPGKVPDADGVFKLVAEGVKNKKRAAS